MTPFTPDQLADDWAENVDAANENSVCDERCDLRFAAGWGDEPEEDA